MYPLRRSIKWVLFAWLAVFVPFQLHAEELLLALRLNGQPVNDGEIVRIDGDRVLLSQGQMRELRLRLPLQKTGDDKTMIDIGLLPGVKTHIDRQALVLDINADPAAFETTRLQGYVPDRPADRPDHPGMFLNYNLLAEDTGETNLASGLFSLGGFSDYGVAMSDVVAGSQQGVIRLRNYLTQEREDGRGSVILGDGFLPQGAIGEEFPFGGVQITSHSSSGNDPRQIPVETILGQASVPSTVDVFVNDALQSRQSVPTGPFVLENIPVATGDGNIRVVVHDALGQEQVVVRSFYTSPYLLPAGRGDYAYQAGLLRRDYGSASFDYAEPFLSGTQRYGWNKWLTTEFHGEVSEQRQVFGEQTSFLVAPYGTIRIGGAASDRDGAPGALAILGAETATHPFSAGFSGEIASHHFTQLGYTGDRTLQQSLQAQLSYDMRASGTLSASLIHLDILGQSVSNTGALSYNLNVPHLGFFGASAFATLGNGATGAILSLSVPMGSSAVANAQVTHDQNGWGQSAQYAQNAPSTGGVGYRALVDHSEAVQRGEAGITYRSAYNEVNLDAGGLNGSAVARAGMTGSLGLFDGQVFAAHETDGNFAVVDTGGIGGIHIYADQQPVGVTDSDGKLVISHLRAHEINHIAIDPADVPFDVSVPKSEMEIVPRAQTGYIVRFKLKHSRTAIASIVRQNGNFVEAGATARNMKTGNSFVIGHNGVVYLTGLSGHDRFEIGPGEQACKIDVILPRKRILQPNLGKLKCQS